MGDTGCAPGRTAVPPCYCPEIGEIVAYWDRIRPAGGLPGRGHFDPVDVPDLLPNIWLLDVFRDPWRFRLRLIGTAIVDFAQRDSTGRWFDEVFPDFPNSDAYGHLVTCAGDGVPVFCATRKLSRTDQSHWMAQRVHLPLAADGRTARHDPVADPLRSGRRRTGRQSRGLTGRRQYRPAVSPDRRSVRQRRCRRPQPPRPGRRCRR